MTTHDNIANYLAETLVIRLSGISNESLRALLEDAEMCSILGSRAPASDTCAEVMGILAPLSGGTRLFVLSQVRKALMPERQPLVLRSIREIPIRLAA